MFPIFIENCEYLGEDVNAITIGPFVFCKPGVDEITRNHELIHYQQHVETLYIGLWSIYAYDYIKGLISGKDSYDAYMSTRAEIEAYDNENNPLYLSQRKRYQWIFPKKAPEKKKKDKTSNRRSLRLALK
jgi:hypothetical protein